MSHDHCDCVEGLEEHVAWLRGRLAEQDARGLRLAGENERLREELTYVRKRHFCDDHQDIHDASRALADRSTEGVIAEDISP